MKIIELFAKFGRSMFRANNVRWEKQAELGTYSYPYPVKNLYIRKFTPGLFFQWHNAPQSQFIIYLEGEVKVTTSEGESRVFKAGDILHANDLTGKGHTSETIKSGTAVIVTLDEERDSYPKSPKSSKP